jgi:tetratricopeptide (TPR) repeat protein
MRTPIRVVVLASLAAAAACRGASTDPSSGAPARGPVWFDTLGSYGRKVTTSSPDAQRWFDQGLTWLYAFNHDEAAQAFGEAARLDPGCAMAYWGIALANGPHINKPGLEPEKEKTAYAAARRAMELASVGAATPVEIDLIAAVQTRYADPPGDRAAEDAAYADAMRRVWHDHSGDADAGTLFAESMMDLRPWDLWTKDATPQPGTLEIVATLDAVLAKRPDHPGACHFLIHSLEASPHPEKALAAADRLRTLVPGAGHLVHMPAHIDLRLGRYADAAAANERAIEADRVYVERTSPPGFYSVYISHNHGFLSYAAMMEGRSVVAIREARATVAAIPAEFVRDAAPLVDGYLAITWHALVRFGKWKEILAEPEAAEVLPLCRAQRHYARGVAFANLGRLDEAHTEAAAFEAEAARVGRDAPAGNSKAADVLAIARNMLAGEIAYKEGRAGEAFAKLREAVSSEDGLHYDEPPDWMMHARHPLGALLLASGRAEEAETVYRDDLARHPENVWSLAGLAGSLRARGSADAAAAEERFRKAAARADCTIDTSCFCSHGR